MTAFSQIHRVEKEAPVFAAAQFLIIPFVKFDEHLLYAVTGRGDADNTDIFADNLAVFRVNNPRFGKPRHGVNFKVKGAAYSLVTRRVPARNDNVIRSLLSVGYVKF